MMLQKPTSETSYKDQFLTFTLIFDMLAFKKFELQTKDILSDRGFAKNVKFSKGETKLERRVFNELSINPLNSSR